MGGNVHGKGCEKKGCSKMHNLSAHEYSSLRLESMSHAAKLLSIKRILQTMELVLSMLTPGLVLS